MKAILCIGIVLLASGISRAQTISLSGDFDLDRQLTVTDIDMLTRVVVFGDQEYDLSGDGWVNDEDRHVWLEELKKSCLGDTNLDGIVGTTDLVLVFQADEYEDDISGNSTWTDGD